MHIMIAKIYATHTHDMDVGFRFLTNETSKPYNFCTRCSNYAFLNSLESLNLAQKEKKKVQI
jgi:hypothetical protein